MNSSTDPQDQNNVIMELIKSCTPFITTDYYQLVNKYYDLHLLEAMLEKDVDEENGEETVASDYSAEVYESIVEMFASNVFRPLPPSSYTDAPDDEMSNMSVDPAVGGATANGPPAANEFTQMANVYQVFRAFIKRALFDADKAAPHMGRRTFVNGLIQRFNSGEAYERMLVCEILTRLWETCPSVRPAVVNSVVAELADFAYNYVTRHNGVEDLLEFIAETVVGRAGEMPAAVDKLSRVLVHLLKHQSLFLFKSKLIHCVKALNNVRKDLIPQMLIFIMKLLPFQNIKTIALLRTMVELYEWCDHDKWLPMQLKIVGHVSKLFTNEDFQLADVSMNFWNRLLHEDITFWKNNQEDVRIVVNALKKVIRTHWNSDCIKMANSLLNIMVINNVINNNYMNDQEELFQEGQLNDVNYILSKHLMMPLKHSIMLPPSLTDASKQTESTV